MDNSVLTKEFHVRYSDMDLGLMLKPGALLHILEDLASESAENLGFGYSFVRKHNLAWFLLKYRMEFVSYPKGVYTLKGETEPRGYNKLFAFRDFKLYDGDTLLGRVASTWSLVDLSTKNIVPVSQVLGENPYMKPFEKREGDLGYEKIHPLNRMDVQKTYEIRFDDIDVNGHANNSNYIVWGFEPLDFDFRQAKKLETLDMMFKKEIKYGGKVVSEAELDGDRTLHVVKSEETGEDLCLISAKWCDK